MPSKLQSCARYCSASWPVQFSEIKQMTSSTLCRAQAAEVAQEHYAQFGKWPTSQQLPIVYNEIYNVSFLGIENLHVFDSKKFKKIVASLERKKMLSRTQVKAAFILMV